MKKPIFLSDKSMFNPNRRLGSDRINTQHQMWLAEFWYYFYFAVKNSFNKLFRLNLKKK